MEIKSPPFKFCENTLRQTIWDTHLSLDREIGIVFTNEFEIPFMGQPGTRGTIDPLKACELELGTRSINTLNTEYITTVLNTLTLSKHCTLTLFAGLFFEPGVRIGPPVILDLTQRAGFCCQGWNPGCWEPKTDTALARSNPGSSTVFLYSMYKTSPPSAAYHFSV